MQMSQQARRRLIQASEAIYYAYLALDFTNEIRCFGENQDKTLTEEFARLANQHGHEAELSTIILVNGQEKPVHLRRVNGDIQLTFDNPPEAPMIKKISDLDEQDMLALMQKQRFTYPLEPFQTEPKMGIQLSEEIKIGGPGKWDLYRTHLMTLFNIIEHLKQGDDLSSILIALATGSGKTFVQALWYLVCQHAKMNTIFALPDELINQFKRDFKRLLPDHIVDDDHIKLLRNEGDCTAALETIQAMAREPLGGHCLIASYEALLDKHYQSIMRIQPDNLSISFDEQHLVMSYESRRVRFIEIAKRFLTNILTATPDEETFILSGEPVAMMSSKEKQDAGQGLFPRIMVHRAKSARDKVRSIRKIFKENKSNALREEKAEHGKVNIGARIKLIISNLIEKQPVSAITSALEDLQYEILTAENPVGSLDKDRVSRWNSQLPTGRKMLLIVDDHEELINLDNYLKNEDENRNIPQPSSKKTKEVYSNGNCVDRNNIYEMLAGGGDYRNEETTAYRDYNKVKQNCCIKNNSLISYNIIDQMELSIVNNFIDFILMTCLDINTQTLNQKRLDDLSGLTDEFENYLYLHNNDEMRAQFLKKLIYDEDHNESGIDESTAHTIVDLLLSMVEKYRQLVMPEVKKKFVDGHLNERKKIYGWFSNDDEKDALNKYLKTHRTLYFVKKMANKETPISEKAFFTFTESEVPLFEDTGLNKKAKKRHRSPIETLDDECKEFHYQPDYADDEINETIADNYFRLGFIAAYVSNKKTQGFSDVNCHTVIQSVPKDDDRNNNPTTVIQAVGRLRGLDETQVPLFVQAIGREVRTYFNVSLLGIVDNYFKPYFKALHAYKNRLLHGIGRRSADKLILWVNAHVDKDQKIQEDELNRQGLRAILKSLRKINNFNAHDIQQSRKDVNVSLKAMVQEVELADSKIDEPYKLGMAVRVIGGLCYGISRIYLAFSLRKQKSAYKKTIRKLKATPAGMNDGQTLYANIINDWTYTKAMENITAMQEVRLALAQRESALYDHIESHVSDYLSDDTIEAINKTAREKLLPLLVRHLQAGDCREEALAVGASYTSWHHLITANKSNFEQLEYLENTELNDDKRARICIDILKQIPGLAHLNFNEHHSRFVASINEASAHVHTSLEEIFTNHFKSNHQSYFASEHFANTIALLYPNNLYEHICKTLQANSEDLASKVHAIITDKKDNIGQEFLDVIQSIIGKEYITTETYRDRLGETLNTLKHELDSIENHIDQKFKEEIIFDLLSNDTIASINQICTQRLLPVMVKSFAPSIQNELFEKLSRRVDWPQLIKDNFTLIKKFGHHDPKKRQVAVIELMRNADACDTKTLQEEYRDVERLAETHQKDLMSLFHWRLMKTYGTACAKSLIRKGKGIFLRANSSTIDASDILRNDLIQDLMKLLIEDKFLDLIEPFFIDSEFESLKLLLDDNASRHKISTLIIDKLDINNLRDTDLDPFETLQAIISANFSEQFPCGIKTLDVSAQEARTELETLSNNIESNPEQFLQTDYSRHALAYLAPDKRDRINQIMQESVVPLLTKCLATGVDISRYTNFNDWPELLFKFKDELEKLNDVPKTGTNEHLQFNALVKEIFKYIHPEFDESEFYDFIKHSGNSAQQFEERLESHYYADSEHHAGLCHELDDYCQNNEEFLKLITHVFAHEGDMPNQLGSAIADDVLKSIRSNSFSEDTFVTILKNKFNNFIPDLGDDFKMTMNDIERRVRDFSARDFNTKKINKLLKNSMKDLILHPETRRVCKQLYRKLTAHDLEILFDSLETNLYDQPKQLRAIQLREILRYIQKNQWKKLKPYLKIPEINGKLEFEQTPMVIMLHAIGEITQEILACQGSYLDITISGGKKFNPKLLTEADPLRKASCKHREGDDSGQLARQFIHLTGLKRGFQRANRICASANKNLRATLHTLKADVIAHFEKSNHHLPRQSHPVFRDTTPELHQSQTESYLKAIKSLQPMHAQDALDIDAPRDVLEQSLASLSTRPDEALLATFLNRWQHYRDHIVEAIRRDKVLTGHHASARDLRRIEIDEQSQFKKSQQRLLLKYNKILDVCHALTDETFTAQQRIDRINNDILTKEMARDLSKHRHRLSFWSSEGSRLLRDHQNIVMRNLSMRGR